MIINISISPIVNPIQIPFDPIMLYNANNKVKDSTSEYNTEINVENTDLSIAS